RSIPGTPLPRPRPRVINQSLSFPLRLARAWPGPRAASSSAASSDPRRGSGIGVLSTCSCSRDSGSACRACAREACWGLARGYWGGWQQSARLLPWRIVAREHQTDEFEGAWAPTMQVPLLRATDLRPGWDRLRLLGDGRPTAPGHSPL